MESPRSYRMDSVIREQPGVSVSVTRQLSHLNPCCCCDRLVAARNQVHLPIEQSR